MMRRAILGSLVCLGLCASPVFAQSGPRHHPAGINARQERQADRIRAGRRDDQLTPAELDRLRGAEAAIRGEERVYRRSGDGLNRAEFRDLERDLNRTSRMIYRARHNGR